MRGKLRSVSVQLILHRITPADAGKTADFRSFECTKQDHPRGCGENLFMRFYKKLPQGSPPRMRGKPFSINFTDIISGITPADAGKTYVLNESLTHAQDHPRGCGENLQIQDLYSKAIGSPPRMRGKPSKSYILPSEPGSPPRMRGKLYILPTTITRGRITPADAGKT